MVARSNEDRHCEHEFETRLQDYELLMLGFGRGLRTVNLKTDTTTWPYQSIKSLVTRMVTVIQFDAYPAEKAGGRNTPSLMLQMRCLCKCDESAAL